MMSSYPLDLINSLCERIHAGEYKTTIQSEVGISVTTLLKHYREWCREKQLTPISAVSYRRNPELITHLKKYLDEQPPKPPDRESEKAWPPLPDSPKIDLALENKKTSPIIPPNNVTVLAVSDMHHPFVHQDALAFLLEVRRIKHTNLSVCLGDEIDACAFSRYPMDPDGMTAGQELRAAIESITPFYREFPEMLICESNHTVRPWKRAYESGLPAAFLPTYAKLLNAPDGWLWFDRWYIDNVLYIHGDNGRSGQYAHIHYLRAAKQSVVIGHIHGYAGINYEGKHFAINAGCLIDENAYCFKYAKNMLVRVNLGCAVIYEGKYGEFVPMRLDTHGRWIGRL